MLAELQESDDPKHDSEQECRRADKIGDASGLRLKSGGNVADIRDLRLRLRRGGNRGCGNCKYFVHGHDFRLSALRPDEAKMAKSGGRVMNDPRSREFERPRLSVLRKICELLGRINECRSGASD